MAENRVNLDLDEVKNFLRLTGTEEDDLLQDLLDTAKERIWDFLNNDFTIVNDDGTITYEDIPRPVEHAVKMLVAYLYQNRTGGVKSEKTGEMSVTWQIGKSGLPLEIEKILLNYRRIPGL